MRSCGPSGSTTGFPDGYAPIVTRHLTRPSTIGIEGGYLNPAHLDRSHQRSALPRRPAVGRVRRSQQPDLWRGVRLAGVRSRMQADVRRQGSPSRPHLVRRADAGAGDPHPRPAIRRCACWFCGNNRLMSPQRSGPLAYYATAGSVLCRSGAEVTASAASLLAFYRREAIEGRRLGDEAGATFCARMALQLAQAAARADAWRRAAGVGRQAAAAD